MVQGKNIKQEIKRQIRKEKHEFDSSQFGLDSSIPWIKEANLEKIGKLTESVITYFEDEDIVLADIEILRFKNGDVEMGPAFKSNYIGIDVPKEKYTTLISKDNLFGLIVMHPFKDYKIKDGQTESYFVVIKLKREDLLAACEKNN